MTHSIIYTVKGESWLDSMDFSLSIKHKFLDINIELILDFHLFKLIPFSEFYFFSVHFPTIFTRVCQEHYYGLRIMLLSHAILLIIS